MAARVANGPNGENGVEGATKTNSDGEIIRYRFREVDR